MTCQTTFFLPLFLVDGLLKSEMEKKKLDWKKKLRKKKKKGFHEFLVFFLVLNNNNEHVK
jgi:hypothetical protein